jgi:hypothetical protein
MVFKQNSPTQIEVKLHSSDIGKKLQEEKAIEGNKPKASFNLSMLEYF